MLREHPAGARLAAVRFRSFPRMSFRSQEPGAVDRNALIAELANVIAAVARGDDAQAREILAGVSQMLAASPQTALPGIPGPSTPVTSESVKRAIVGRLFAYWQDRCEHKTAKLTPDRVRSIMSRLKDGYSELEIRKAIDGAAVAAYVNEESGQKYDDLTLICRNGSKLESFIARGVTATGAIDIPITDATPLEEQINALRVTMSELKKTGRLIEYEAQAAELTRLMSKRERKTT